MQELFIDRGNTALKWQLCQQGEVVLTGASANGVELDQALSKLSEVSLAGVYVASVAGEDVECAIRSWATKHSQPKPVFIKSSSEACGVTNAYAEPERLGVDRWLAMIAAHHHYSGMLCVVDSGTALTMDFLSASGQHLGGFIVPGAELMRRSLLQNTQEIHLNSTVQSNQLGMNTSEAVLLGTEQMLQAFVSQKISDVELGRGQSVSLILTGGHANSLAVGLGTDYKEEPDLVFQGLRLAVEALA